MTPSTSMQSNERTSYAVTALMTEGDPRKTITRRSKKLNRKKMFAKQLSKRGGELWCEDLGNRVIIAGQCVFYMKGEISVAE